MTSVDVAFLVNGGEGSAAGERAERIAARLPDGAAVVAYRPAGRAGALAHMARTVRTHRPRVVYAMDLAAANIGAWVLGGSPGHLIVDTGDTPRSFLELIGASPAKVRAAALLEQQGYGRASQIVVRGDHHAAQLRRAGYSQIDVIEDGVDLGFFAPVDAGDLRQTLGLSDVLTVGMQGNFTWYPELGGGLGWELVEALGRNRDLEVHAVIIGAGPGIGELRRMADGYGIADRLHVMGRVPYQELPRYLSLCDVCLLTQTNDPSSWARTTGKLPGFLATGRHILASRVGTAAGLLPDDMLIDYFGAWDPTYPDRLAERLKILAGDRQRTREAGLELRRLAAAFDYEDVAERCAEHIRRLIGR